MSDEFFEQLVRGEITDEEYKRQLKYMEFKVGMRVRHKKHGEGTVKGCFRSMNKYIGVEFDNNIGGHDLNGNVDGIIAKDGHGWWCKPYTLEVLEDEWRII